MRNLILIASACLTLTVVACVAEDYATPTEVGQLEALDAAGDTEGAAAVERGIAERTVGNLIGLVESRIPLPLKIFTPFLATLFFPRIRRQAVKTIKEAADVAKKTVTGDFSLAGKALGDMVDSALSVVGLTDSRKDTLEEMQEQADALRAGGNAAGATLLEAQISAMKSREVG